MNLRVPLRLTQRPIQPVRRLHHRVANRRLSRLYEANMGAEMAIPMGLTYNNLEFLQQSYLRRDGR